MESTPKSILQSVELRARIHAEALAELRKEKARRKEALEGTQRQYEELSRKLTEHAQFLARYPDYKKGANWYMALGLGSEDWSQGQESAEEHEEDPDTAFASKFEDCGTSIAPDGWYCTRMKGHTGPCAGKQLVEPDINQIPKPGVTVEEAVAGLKQMAAPKSLCASMYQGRRCSLVNGHKGVHYAAGLSWPVADQSVTTDVGAAKVMVPVIQGVDMAESITNEDLKEECDHDKPCNRPGCDDVEPSPENTGGVCEVANCCLSKGHKGPHEENQEGPGVGCEVTDYCLPKGHPFGHETEDGDPISTKMPKKAKKKHPRCVSVYKGEQCQRLQEHAGPHSVFGNGKNLTWVSNPAETAKVAVTAERCPFVRDGVQCQRLREHAGLHYF